MQASRPVQPSDAATALGRVHLSSLLLTFAPVLIVLVLVALKLTESGLYAALIVEDGPFENATALAYLAASIIAALTGVLIQQRGDRLFGAIYFGFAATFLFIAGEEISWGQRIFEIQSPEFFLEHNVQEELNAHNFLSRRPLQAIYIVVSFGAAFGWYLAPKLMRFLPARIQSLFAGKLWMLLPERRLMLYPVPCLLFYVYFDYINPIVWRLLGPEWDALSGRPGNFLLPKDQEALEMILAFGFCLFVLLVFRQVRKGLVK